MSDSRQVTITIINKLGLHARAASKLVSTASRFASRVDVVKGGQRADAKSIMSVLMLAASQGTVIELHGSGHDVDEAIEAITALINNRFDEAE